VAADPFEEQSLARLRQRAEDAAAAGHASFALPEALPVAERVAATVGGELRAEAERWHDDGAQYHALVRLVARAVLELGRHGFAGEAVYVPKASGELEPMLRLWPGVLVLPTIHSFSAVELIALRAFPVHPLGMVSEPTWADGRLCDAAEYFFHDLDHARFKIREDLAVEGIEIPDAYAGDSTVDARTGQHRLILPAADGKIGSKLWNRAPARRELSTRLSGFAAALGEPRAAAAELLLFEILCEKSHALDVNVLARELDSGAHVQKIRQKYQNGFYGDDAPTPATMAAIDEARRLLRETL
jgi:hypothetical protein